MRIEKLRKVYSIQKSLFTGHWKIALAYVILTITPFCVRTSMAITMAIFQKYLALFHHKLAQHNFWKFIFNFDARCVSRKFTTNSCLQFMLSVVLERTVRFLITAGAVLE